MAAPTRMDRLVAFFFGLFFCGIALAIVLAVQPLSTGALIAAIVLGGVGLEAVLASLRGKRALLARIGPLP